MHKICAFCLFGLVFPVSAIVVQNYGTAETAPSAAGLDLDWDYVYNYKGSSAVSVGRGWLLTAGHVADDGGDGSLTIGTTDYQQQEIVYHPDADLALVRYDKALPGYYDLYTGVLFDTPRLEVLLVGFGTTGSVASAYFTDSGSGKGTKRWGSQIIDRTFIKKYDSNGTVGYTENYGFEMGFNTNSTIHEAGGGVGDSGSGVFYNDGGVWKLAGINTSRSGGPHYTGTFAISMPYYADWITDAIPEPAAIGLMGFATVGLLLSRAKRRRRVVGRSVFPIEYACDMFVDSEEMEPEFPESEGKEHLRVLKQTVRVVIALVLNSVQQGCRRFDHAMWSYLTASCERRKVRIQTVSTALNKGFVQRLDTFLEKVRWDRMACAHKARKQAIKAAFRRLLP